MNIIIWNSRGALKPNIQSHVRELSQAYSPSIMVIIETHLGGPRAKEIIDTLPFDGAIHTETIRYAEGLWLLWNLDRIEITPLANTEQEIHVVVKVRPLNTSWLLSAVYASPRIAERRILWNNLLSVTELNNLSWLLIGDFNEPLVSSDKYCGRVVNINNSLQFKECLDRCNMVDLWFSGPRYTWTNKRGISGLIQERIDKFFVTPDWWHLYPEAQVTHLTRRHFDHCPVILESNPRRPMQRPRPFVFQSF